MRTSKFITIGSLVLTIILLGTTCEEENPLTDAQKLAALRHVKLTYNGMSYDIGFPAGALSGQSFGELMASDPTTYSNPANYSVAITVNATADNSDPGEEDAKFDGLGADVVMDTLDSEPIQMLSNAFEVKKGKTHPVVLETSINMETHRKSCLYIFRQTVDGNDLSTTIKPYLLYDIGSLEGEIPLPALHKDIPTAASAETKDFLRQLLDSGLFTK